MGCTPSRVGPNPARQAGLTEAAREAADLTEPLAATHFHDRARLAALVLGPAGDATTADADIRLLSARKLVAYIDGGGRLAIRQTLEAEGKDIFLDRETARALLPELETKDMFRCTFSGVVALSYAWVRADDPDPEGAQLAQLRPVLVWWMCERARRKTVKYSKHQKPDATIQTADFGVFIDFMSMHQPDSGWKEEWKCNTTYSKPEQKASFDRALGNIGLLYGHYGTSVFKLTATPLGPGGDPNRVYTRRGWTHLERRLGDLEAPAFNSLDVSAWPTAEAERAAREKDAYGNPTTEAQRGPPQLRKSEKELAAQALGLGNNISKDSESEADEKGRDGLLAKPVTQTLKESMTVENYDEDITKYDDKALGSKLNLSTTEVEKGAPKNNKGDKWREQYRQEEDAAGAAE